MPITVPQSTATSPSPSPILDLEPYIHPPAPARTRALLAETGSGQVHIVLPEQAFFDIIDLERQLGMNLDLHTLNPLQPVAAIPGFYDCPTIVDRALVTRDVVALPTDQPGGYVRARGEQLAADRADVILSACCDPLADVSDPGDAAEDRIHACISEFTELRIQRRLDETLSIPPLPETARRIIALKANPDYDLDDLVQIVELDPALAARIIGWANSGFYQANPPAESINDAVMRVLGFDLVMNMALGLALSDNIEPPQSKVRGVSDFWVTAVFGAVGMEILSRYTAPELRPEPGTAYLAGLLANFGTLVIGHVFPPQYARICRQQEANRHVDHSLVDQRVIGLPREIIGSVLLESWAVPQPACDAVRYQHQSAYQGSNQTYVRLLQLTRRVLANESIGDAPPGDIDPGHIDDLGIDAERLASVREQLLNARDEIDALVRVMGGAA